MGVLHVGATDENKQIFEKLLSSNWVRYTRRQTCDASCQTRTHRLAIPESLNPSHKICHRTSRLRDPNHFHKVFQIHWTVGEEDSWWLCPEERTLTKTSSEVLVTEGNIVIQGC